LKGYLLDTGVALMAMEAPETLSRPILTALHKGPGFLSAIAYWEVLIKSMKGTLDVGDPRQWWSEALAELALQPLSCRSEHIAAIYNLPPLHQDPFDRAMIAQAAFEDLTLLTTDAVIPRYASTRLRVVS
jgi:PIN domain nuclease of toxin-antitoxin system